jgi:hypothetical protein
VLKISKTMRSEASDRRSHMFSAGIDCLLVPRLTSTGARELGTLHVVLASVFLGSSVDTPTTRKSLHANEQIIFPVLRSFICF